MLCITVLYTCLSCNVNTNKNDKVIKIALRDAGDKLLLSSGDTTSIVKPIIALDNNTYQLTFEKPLVIQPDTLVSIFKTSFKKAHISEHYITEVLECNKNEVAYSYAIRLDAQESLVPCSGRELVSGCYTIQVHFLAPTFKIHKAVYVLVPIVLLILILVIYKIQPKNTKNKISEPYTAVGDFMFYPEQNKLIKEAVEIKLSKKECELLDIFVAQPNTVIKREELTKRVWEDNGVIVGRSLDTYISKLRKKLQADANIKLTNVHGVGYKLEVA